MSHGISPNREPRDKHMASWVELIDLLAEPRGAGRVDFARPSHGEATGSKSRTEKSRTTNNEETTRTGNGPENTTKTHKNHFSVLKN
jgi:hypothetical protein